MRSGIAEMLTHPLTNIRCQGDDGPKAILVVSAFEDNRIEDVYATHR